jgi:hypothetical protein
VTDYSSTQRTLGREGLAFTGVDGRCRRLGKSAKDGLELLSDNIGAEIGLHRETTVASFNCREFNRHDFLKVGTAALAAPYLGAGQSTGTGVADADCGTLRRGRHKRRTNSLGAQPWKLAFKGIPYARSVFGRNRFKTPSAVTPWTGVRDETLLGLPRCRVRARPLASMSLRVTKIALG